MTDLLKPQQVVQSLSGKPCTVLKFLGGGGQGEVYRALWGDKEFALKWYYSNIATKPQREVLEDLVKRGAPSDMFLWPEDLATASGVPGYGYLMPLREQRYKSLTDLVAGRVDPTFLALIRAGIELVKAFRDLHTNGLCYRDISFGNAFFDPLTGDVRVCDNDNVTPNRSKKGGILGTPDFMAPELVRNSAVPSTNTDLYSLSVLLFYLFFISHPLLGKRVLSVRCFDTAARRLLFGDNPVFIFDPNDQSNAAQDIAHDPMGEAGSTAIPYWEMYPKVFRDTFIKAFSIGLRDADARVTELEWLYVLSTLRDAVYKCACGKVHFYDAEAMKMNPGDIGTCDKCDKPLKLPYRIRIGKNIVMLNADSKLYAHHMGDGREFDFLHTVAEVVRHPTDPARWGLKNLTSKSWVITLPDGSPRDAGPGKSAPLLPNTRISFGRVEGEIRY